MILSDAHAFFTVYVYPGISCQKTPTVYGYPVVPPKKTFSRKQGQHTLFQEKTGVRPFRGQRACALTLLCCCSSWRRRRRCSSRECLLRAREDGVRRGRLASKSRAPVDDVVATMTSMAPCSAFALQDRRGASSLKAMLLLRGAAGSSLGVVGGQWYPCRRRAANMSGVLIPVM